MINDKIFGNTYGDGAYDGSTSFKVDPSYESGLSPEDAIHYDILMKKIDDIIKNSSFAELNKVTPDGNTKKLNKIQINQVFLLVINSIGADYTRVDVFGSLSDYFDIIPNKFYNSLSNKYKDELIRELDNKYNILKKKNIRTLF
jgi:hypothetical protein